MLPFTFEDPLVDGTRVTPARLRADDDMESGGFLYEPVGARRQTVLFLSHPRAEFGRHYLIPGLIRAGWAVMGHNSRYLNNDVEMVQERLLLDVAAAMRWARGRFGTVVLVGNSGGGALLARYQAESTRAPADRPRDGAGGGRVDLTGEMPAGDALIVLAAHSGEGRFLLRTIDPAVTDEADPLSRDSSLDMFDPANGYDPQTLTATYAPTFIERYRAAQRARVARIDEVARREIAMEREARLKVPYARSAAEAQSTARCAIPHRLLLVYGTVADPAYVDLSLEANDREIGSIFGIVRRRPEFGNFFAFNIARVVSPRAWLSTWSGLSSRGDFMSSARSLRVPVLFVAAGGDSDIRPPEAATMWSSIGCEDRTRKDLAGADHYLRPVPGGRTGTDPRVEVIETIDSWLRQRFSP